MGCPFARGGSQRREGGYARENDKKVVGRHGINKHQKTEREVWGLAAAHQKGRRESDEPCRSKGEKTSSREKKGHRYCKNQKGTKLKKNDQNCTGLERIGEYQYLEKICAGKGSS